ncbi:MAG: hypothetical protein PHH40_04615 [Candidatus Moranbacteria bacterium]|nr:hypothetical protein [Candidatus Moranbacteria bacterium]MDD3964482.1 hypothetical protein [Candidatus Moranbacteria bacterium]
MTEEEIKKRVQEIEAVYQTYLEKLFTLKKEQDNVITEFEKVLSSERIQEIKKSLGLL